jgi:hypothetical protein
MKEGSLFVLFCTNEIHRTNQDASDRILRGKNSPFFDKEIEKILDLKKKKRVNLTIFVKCFC